MAGGKHILGKPKNHRIFGTARVGERGQIVIPKEARQFYDIRPGDTVLVLGSGESGLVLSKPEVLDRVARQNGEPLDLRRREFDLLELLMRNRGAALYRDVIFERVWGELPDTESLRTVDTHIARLRKKLGWTDKQIETVFKIGYRLRKE